MLPLQDARDELLLLLLGAPLQDGRADQGVAEEVGPQWRARPRANSSLSTTCCEQLEPLAAVLGRPAGADPAPCVELVRPLLVEGLALLGVMEKPGSPQPSGRFSLSHPAISARNSSASGGYVRSMRSTVPGLAGALRPAARPVARGATGAAVLPVPGNLVTLFLNTQGLEPVVTPVTPFPILILLTTGWAPGTPGRRCLRRDRGFGEAMRPWRSASGHPLPKTPRQKWIETKESWERSRHVVVPAPVPAAAPRPGGLRVAFLIYRGNPRCGGQGVYTRHLTRELVALGHSVEVFARPALARARRGRRLHPRGRPRPLPRPRPVPDPPPPGVHGP